MKRELVVIAHKIRSVHNVGAIFRTSDGAGIAKIYLTGWTAAPPRKDMHKVALGAEEHVPFEKRVDPLRLIRTLKKKGYTLACLENNVESELDIRTYTPQYPLALFVGNEVDGIPEDVLSEADVILSLPMRGKKESLNVSVAFGIAVYELTRSWK